MRARRRLAGRSWLAGLSVAALLLTACSGVPTSSLPQVVRTVEGPGVATATPTVRPEPTDDAQATVTKFLDAQLTNDESHQAAKAFLTPQAVSQWKDNSLVTVITDRRVGVDVNNVLTVSGQTVGTLDPATGVYTPNVTGSDTPSKPIIFHVTQVSGLWKITGTPPIGLIVDERDFRTSFPRRILYFFNQAGTGLVADLRYSPLEGQSLATWTLQQLIAGPLQPTSLRSEIPDSIDLAKVTLSQPINVQLPGLRQSDAATIRRVAAEISYSFESFAPASKISLFDGTTLLPVVSNAATFTAADFQYEPVATTLPQLYYIRDRTLYNAQSTAIPIKGATQYPFVSVAVAGAPGSEQIAGLTAAGDRLYVGTPSGGLRSIALRAAATSRPEWTPVSPREIWMGIGPGRGQGPALVRIDTTASTPVKTIQLTGGNDVTKLSVVAVRLSPEGARVALVLRSADDARSVWVGSIARSGSTVTVDGLHQVSPSDWDVRDVAWSTLGILLRAIGSQPGVPIEVWQLNYDGSFPADPSTEGLPALPDAITSTSDGTTYVSASDRIWQESLGNWADPFPGDQQRGTAPVYAVG